MERLINMNYEYPVKRAIMDSMRKHWKGLTIFVDNPDIPMDNNLAERMLRGAVLGRKNYYGNHSIWAGELSWRVASIEKTCILAGISPRAYLTYYFKKCLENKDILLEEILSNKLSVDIKEDLGRMNKEQIIEVLDTK